VINAQGKPVIMQLAKHRLTEMNSLFWTFGFQADDQAFSCIMRPHIFRDLLGKIKHISFPVKIFPLKFVYHFVYPSEVQTFKKVGNTVILEKLSKKNWSGRRDLNPRPQPWQGCALPLSYARIIVVINVKSTPIK
jgi:hypothetical protein